MNVSTRNASAAFSDGVLDQLEVCNGRVPEQVLSARPDRSASAFAALTFLKERSTVWPRADQASQQSPHGGFPIERVGARLRPHQRCRVSVRACVQLRVV
jgi:hypothetical protein